MRVIEFLRLTLCAAILSSAALWAQAAPGEFSIRCEQGTDCSNRILGLLKQFGPDFKLVKEFPPLFGDLNGDGEEDAVLVATGSPLGGQQEFGYKVLDPYNSYFGWGDPKVTATFESAHPGGGRHVLIIHSWKADKVKAKFVIINLPFERLALTRVMVKKKTAWAIGAMESSALASATFWDGKNYRWRPDYMSE
jgi:hypothetical protein